MKKQLRLAVTMTAVLFSTGVSLAQDKVVNVYNWSDYIDSSILEDFTKETGIKVIYDTFDSNEILETKLLTGGSGYDVVVPAGPFLARQIQAGVFQKLDKSKLPNLKNMWPEVMTLLAKYDPGNEHAVNYMWGTTGIGYNVDKVKAKLGDVPIDSWDVLLKPENAAKLESCGVNIVDAPDETFAIAMNYLGKDGDSKKTEDLEAGGDVYAKIRGYVRTFNSSTNIEGLANGDICITIGWSGDILQAKNRAEEAKNGVRINYLIPKEGTYMWFDNLAIPADAKHVDEAHAFINYLMKPEVIAKSSNYVQTANGNLASQKFLDEAVLKNPSVYPTEETLAKLFTIYPYEHKEQRVLTRLWTRIKTGN
ncbi:polyamine ABC transporter substrate-binding protein [Mesorhizobium sp.]|uniref:polyamine ABC transporter substrate-binding protein n=1 Tax=Mesorhizobium sp. TaxID=1871066 RepID=UPI000FE4B7DF|nr:polyamine ABC transporter substrate-binding protein [Mesorhizobium sp.]RWI16167.1 MAG: polyamine ABC transporter substrate-binding protein [Mesorhizobium sp.]RWK50218.1 MAG: polyamine ABC transporter substrate-binding protein [Mesorhizobium sp.]RWK93611.1 MAG: polyamine ABC transporter substrate-binding protein [Mesorhizobium sp.]RWL13938.1 MAG: polyamine ABC transporter substrate-binding protein [Mesorhizobium sp.]TIP60809.1 MAG: polyamine ABC transporter substrate-binding protein [Mesorhi